MNETKTLLTTPFRVMVMVGFLLMAVMALSGCAEPTAIAAVPPTATVFAPPPTEAPVPPPEPTPAAMDFPLAAPSQEPVQTVNDQTCVDCHTDEDALRAVAEEEEVVEELSEGEG